MDTQTNDRPMTACEAYTEDCRRKPYYHTGQRRPKWDDLPDFAKWSWQRNPTPRDW